VTFAKSSQYGAIVVNSRKQAEAQKVADLIQGSFGCKSIAIEADMSREADCVRLIKQTLSHYSRVDVLVNNAGIQQEARFEDTPTAVWSRIIAVNLTGPFICSREAVKSMISQSPKGGCIINISSVHQEIPKPHYVPYATSKAGIEMMTKTLALELACENIRVNAVAPGAIETEMNHELKDDKQVLDKVLKRIPLRRIGTPEEVAQAVDFLASDNARYITGTSLLVDGGMTLYPSFGPSFDINRPAQAQ
jgi:glucose 1-dehydrogenase